MQQNWIKALHHHRQTLFWRQRLKIKLKPLNRVKFEKQPKSYEISLIGVSGIAVYGGIFVHYTHSMCYMHYSITADTCSQLNVCGTQSRTHGPDRVIYSIRCSSEDVTNWWSVGPRSTAQHCWPTLSVAKMTTDKMLNSALDSASSFNISNLISFKNRCRRWKPETILKIWEMFSLTMAPFVARDVFQLVTLQYCVISAQILSQLVEAEKLENDIIRVAVWSLFFLATGTWLEHINTTCIDLYSTHWRSQR